MTEYNFKDIDAFHDIWVLCEQREGKLLNTDFELLGLGRELAGELGCKLYGLLLGDQVESLATELGGYGADEVIVCDHALLSDCSTDGYAKVICDLVHEMKPAVFLIGASPLGRDLAPRLAARLHTGLTADCTHLDISMEKYVDFLKHSAAGELDESKLDMADKKLKMTRPAFGGHLMATIVCPNYRPQMSTIRPGVMQKLPYDEKLAKAVKVIKPKIELSAEDIRTSVVDIQKVSKKLVDLVGADVIVSVGRGIIKDPQCGIKLAEELAQALGGGVVGSSRVCVDEGWISADHQVGQTGKTVRPKIYVALGISGTIQHIAGMSDSDLIIAINKNSSAPIFQIADYGIVGDLFSVVPTLIKSINEEKAK